MQATFGIERERENRFRMIEYHNGNGDFHFHSQIEICLVTGGEIDALVNDHLKRLKKGEVSVALSYDTHLYTPVSEADFTVLIVPTELCEEFMALVKGKRITHPFLDKNGCAERIARCFEAIKKNQNNILTIKGNIYVILGLIAQNAAFEDRAFTGEQTPISEILLYVHDHFSEDISLSFIARQFGYNPTYLSHLFKSYFNLGITRYINMLRLKNAVTLLQEGKYGTTYCALESGFRSLRTFYRAFRDEFGCSPKEYLEKEGKQL